MGVLSAAEAPLIGKLDAAPKVTPAEEDYLESRLASCNRRLENVSRTITAHDPVLLERYVREAKKRYVAELKTQSRRAHPQSSREVI